MDAEQQLLLRAKNKDQQAFDVLQNQYRPLITDQATKTVKRLLKMQEKTFDQTLYEDCRQEALIAFHRAVVSYDFAKEEVTFGLYAKICIRNRLISYARKQKRIMERASDRLETQRNRASCEEAKTVMSQEVYARLSQLISLLSPFEQEVLHLRSTGEKPREIARSLGKSPKVVYNALSRIQAKRKAMQSQ